MWVTDDGVLHTVSLPDVTTAMSDRFFDRLNALSDEDAELLSNTLVDRQDVFYEEFETMGVSVPNAPTTPDDDALPDEYLDTDFNTLGELLEFLDGIHPRWRLDAYVAVQHCLWRDDPQPRGLSARLGRLSGRDA